MPNVIATVAVTVTTSVIVGIVCYKKGQSDAFDFAAQHFGRRLAAESLGYIAARDFLRGRM